MTDHMVRMGELAVSADEGDVLVSLGLGSCIGVALVDRRRRIAGLAHVMLPSSDGHASASIGKFADTAIPELLERITALGALLPRVDAALVGGAQMFALAGGSTLDVGNRNAAAVEEQLAKRRIRIQARATGGNKGRTVRVAVAGGVVSFKEAGASENVLLGEVTEVAA